jgi:nucleotide-binding universal stress UspA family protein
LPQAKEFREKDKRHNGCSLLFRIEEDRMETMRKTILAAVDFSPASEKALQTAVRLAEELNARLYCLYVIDTTDVRYALKKEIQGDLGSSVLLKKRVKKYVEDSFLNFIERGVGSNRRIKKMVGRGRPSLEILRTAEKLQPTLIVLGTRGLGAVKSVFLGSTARDVIRSSSCPVVVVHKRIKGPGEKRQSRR